MKNIIEIKNMTVKYGTKIILNDISLDIESNSYITICGKNGCGKTTFLKALLGIIPTNSNSKINSFPLNEKNVKKMQSDISVVFENPDDNLLGETVWDELKLTLKKSQLKKQESDEKIKDLATKLKFEHLLQEITTHLSEGEKQLISFAKAIIKEPKLIILDEAFSMMNGTLKNRALKYLKKYYKNSKCTILTVTNDMEEILNGNNIIIIKDGLISFFDKNEEALKNERIFKNANLNLPFMADLSLKLKYYGLVDEPILDMDKMVKHLWK